MDFTETDEQKALRSAVAELGKRYGHEYTAPRARAHVPLTELWAEVGKSGFIGLNLPEQYGGGGAGMYELAIVGEELNAAGCGLLMMVVSPAINGTIIAKYGTDAQKQRWLPGIASGETIMAFGRHRARRRLQHPQDHHHGPPRRQRLAAVRPQVLRLRRRPRRRDPHRRPHRGRQDRQPQARPVHLPHRHPGLRVPTHRHGRGHARPAVHALHGRRAAARRRPRRRGVRRGRARAAVRRPQPGTDHGRRRLGRHGPLRPRQGRLLRERAHRLGWQAHRHPPGPLPSARQGQGRAGDVEADDAEGRHALRRVATTMGASARPPTWPSTPPRRPRSPASTRPSRPTAATAWLTSTAWAPCSSTPGSPASPRSAAK